MESTLFKNLFEGMPLDRLMTEKSHYELLVAQNSPNYTPPVNQKTGRPYKIYSMPWMLDAYSKGLAMVNDAIKKATA